MEDPLPENIDGSKRVVHSVNHHINWGYVAVWIGAIVVAVEVASVFESSGGDGEEESVDLDGEPVDIVV